MKNNTDVFMEKAFKTLNQISVPSCEQKESILQKVLIQSQSEKVSTLRQLKNMVVVYPWRFSFGASVIQAIIFTLLFGSNYTNFLLQFMGR